MDQIIVDFINEYQDLIENNEWEEVYNRADSVLDYYSNNIGQFTKTL